MKTMEVLEEDFGINRQTLHRFKKWFTEKKAKYDIQKALSSFYFLKEEMDDIKKADTLLRANRHCILSSIPNEEDRENINEALSILESFVSRGSIYVK